MSMTTEYRSIGSMDQTFKVEEIAHLFDLDPEEVVAIREFYRASKAHDDDFCKAPPMRAVRRRQNKYHKRRQTAMVERAANQTAKIHWFVRNEGGVLHKIRITHCTHDQQSKQKAVNRLGQKLDHYVARRFWGTRLILAANS